MTRDDVVKNLMEQMVPYECSITEAECSDKDALYALEDNKNAVIALKMAIGDIEKQIPKEPNWEGDGYDQDGNLVFDTWICPNCGKHYEVDYQDYSYCPECGQAILRGEQV